MGIFLPEQNELYLYFTASGVTADFIVDCLCDFWQTVRDLSGCQFVARTYFWGKMGQKMRVATT
jgi:hypothetical protein